MRLKEKKLKSFEAAESKRRAEVEYLKQQLTMAKSNTAQTQNELAKLKEILQALTRKVKDTEALTTVVTTQSNYKNTEHAIGMHLSD